MKRLTRSLAAVVPVAALLHVVPAAAVTMHVTDLPIHQVGISPTITVGHFIDARSWFQNLTITGGFRVNCSETAIPDIVESYSATQTIYSGENVFSKAIPEPLPAQRNLGGWNKVRTGTVINCTYRLQARAVESGINFGTGGASIPIGNGEQSEERAIYFDVLKTGIYNGPGCLL